MTRNAAILLAATVATVAFGVTPARADAIDGTWCSQDGRTFQISGPQIVTWGGTRMSGDYDRHNFRYVIPSNEKDAGAKVIMNLLGEEVVRVSVDNTEPQIWNRCRPSS